MTHVLAFVEHTASDLRGGRHTWRVLTILWAVALATAVLARLVVH